MLCGGDGSLIRGAVLEGCSMAGKTSVLKALKRRQSERELELSVVVIGEHYSQVLQKVKGEYEVLSQAEHRQLLSDRLETLEKLQGWGRKLGPSAQSRGVFFALERFHLNHRLGYEEEADDDESWYRELEQRLKGLHATCVLLTISEACVADRVEYRQRSSGKPIDAESLEEERRGWVRQQARYLRAARDSSVPTIIVNTDDLDWTRYADQILDELGTPTENEPVMPNE